MTGVFLDITTKSYTFTKRDGIKIAKYQNWELFPSYSWLYAALSKLRAIACESCGITHPASSRPVSLERQGPISSHVERFGELDPVSVGQGPRWHPVEVKNGDRFVLILGEIEASDDLFVRLF